jgi:hypothetical protein
MTSLMYSNLRADDHLEYSVTVGMPEDHHSTEYWNTKLIVSMEERVRHFFAFTRPFEPISFLRPYPCTTSLPEPSRL